MIIKKTTYVKRKEDRVAGFGLRVFLLPWALADRLRPIAHRLATNPLRLLLFQLLTDVDPGRKDEESGSKKSSKLEGILRAHG